MDRSLAQRARQLVASATHGALSTLDASGRPFGSSVVYAAAPDGRPVLCLSALAEHTRNVARDPRASLLIMEGPTPDEARVTLVGRMRRVDDVHRDVFMAAHPNASWTNLPDFSWHALEVEDVRYVGGFGVMGWLTAGDYSTAETSQAAPSSITPSGPS